MPIGTGHFGGPGDLPRAVLPDNRRELFAQIPINPPDLEILVAPLVAAGRRFNFHDEICAVALVELSVTRGLTRTTMYNDRDSEWIRAQVAEAWRLYPISSPFMMGSVGAEHRRPQHHRGHVLIKTE